MAGSNGYEKGKERPEVLVEFPGRGFSRTNAHLAPPVYRLVWPDGGYCYWEGTRWMVQFADGQMVEAAPEQAKLYDTIVGRK
ncbi:MAG: hypothetical protein WC851_03120 [Candidatus Shapirobacteria bacterium]